MVRMSVKGVHRVRKRLKGGRVVEYHYAWRGGPRLTGKPGGAEYLASLHKARESAKRHYDQDTLAGLIASYQASAKFSNLADATKRDYRAMFEIIRQQYGDMTFDVLEDRAVRGEFKSFRDSMLATPRKADRFWQVLKLLLNFGFDAGLLKWNPAAGGGKLYHGTRADIIWQPHEIAVFTARASAAIHGPFLCALETGQRQGDILALKWNQYDGAYIRLVQRKTGRRVKVMASARLKALMDALPRVSTHVFVTSRGTPWTSDGYQGQFRKTCQRAGIADRHFHDLRGTFITMRRREGSRIEDIALTVGLSIADVRSVLEKHYLAADTSLSDAVILRMERNR